ncbi:MAG: PD-(D/E)XK nuclease family protein, partial [Acidimicrobiales bacterium]
MSGTLSEGQTLNPAQRQVLDELGTLDRPSFRLDLRADLRHNLEEALEPIVAKAADAGGPLFVSKRQLGMLHGCEARYVADKAEEFVWSIPSARGSVAHKAIELMVAHRGNPTPLDLVEGAMARIEADEKGLSTFIQELNEAERAELSGRANDFVTTFTETFPPLSRKWVPVAESSVRALLCDDRLTLMGRVDLSLGRTRGQEAGKVLIDLKTGQPSHAHLEDLRFYALLETMKIGVPPRLLVNYYLDAGTPRNEVVTEDLLWSAAQRVVDAVSKLVALDPPDPKEPTRTPGQNCRWCPINTACEPGIKHLEAAEQ